RRWVNAYREALHWTSPKGPKPDDLVWRMVVNQSPYRGFFGRTK
ncbi:MAG: hypothetical protein RIS35_2263, partial [Pseudomonadota bacterium]